MSRALTRHDEHERRCLQERKVAFAQGKRSFALLIFKGESV